MRKTSYRNEFPIIEPLFFQHLVNTISYLYITRCNSDVTIVILLELFYQRAIGMLFSFITLGYARHMVFKKKELDFLLVPV